MSTPAPTTTLPTPTNHAHLLPLIRTYFALTLRADQKRTLIHQKLQQNRYMNITHGPPYERFEHWNRCLDAAKLEYEGVELEWRERDEGLEEGFEGRVREGIKGLERVLGEMRGLE